MPENPKALKPGRPTTRKPKNPKTLFGARCAAAGGAEAGGRAGGVLQGERAHPAGVLPGPGLLRVRRRQRALRVGRLPRQAQLGCLRGGGAPLTGLRLE